MNITDAAVDRVISGRSRDIGGFSVRRLLPDASQRSVGPWIFFDHMGPVSFPPGQGVNVLPHPHINLATVTYLFEGEIFHRDSLGSEQAILPGDINLMVAGRGIVHSERTRPELRHSGQRVHGLQLWLALPEAEEECKPAFYHYPAGKIPALEIEGVPLRVMMGSAYGVSSPVLSLSKTLYVEARLKTGQSLPLPTATERALYVAEGEVQIQDRVTATHHLAVVNDSPSLAVTARQNSMIAIIGGKPLGRRYLYWNFASSRRERLEQAKTDWQEDRFPGIPGDDRERIPLP